MHGIEQYSTEWPKKYELEAKKIRAVLDDEVKDVQHIGSREIEQLFLICYQPNFLNHPKVFHSDFFQEAAKRRFLTYSGTYARMLCKSRHVA